ncbi:TetR family transcriptional regulator [Agromyces sp. CFH 90414]|uniref:TetR family transcriptional regulator n=1 Tax=Agromyces agglutinans TaxID=2662258 RepID=A0A6I2F3Y2_9MICO|nr:TetR/AcrR family transcriptional regulator [Agromyces agglutinans]MRG59292.1 TetR family transcriptional regulator [Agromyces agglutinans]
MSSATSTRRDARRNHERLLAEARTLFAERGIDAPLDELATRAGVGAGTVYRHFPSRDALLRELYDQSIAMFHEMAPEIHSAPTGWRSIELLLERLSEWIAATPYLPELMRRVAEIDPHHRPGLAFADGLEKVIERAKAEGSLRSDVESSDLNVLINMLGSLGRFGGDYLPFWRRQLAIVLDGLRARPGLEPLPGPAQSFDDFDRMAHRQTR